MSKGDSELAALIAAVDGDEDLEVDLGVVLGRFRARRDRAIRDKEAARLLPEKGWGAVAERFGVCKATVYNMNQRAMELAALERRETESKKIANGQTDSRLTVAIVEPEHGTMDSKRWQQIKNLQPSTGRYVHVSCKAGMRPNPLDERLPWIPWVQKPGVTLNLGRNKAKREIRKGARKTWRVLPRAA